MADVVTGVTYRTARQEDIERTYEIAVLAQNHLAAAHNFPQEAGGSAPPARALAFRRSVLEHDAQRFWVAEAEGQIVGFGIGILRKHLCYLAALHVVPEYQGRGIGRRLLELSMGKANAPAARIWTAISDSLNPISNGLYARFGMYQWIPLIPLKGRLAPEAGAPARDILPSLPLRITQISVREALADLDEKVYGVRRDVDHRLWSSQPDMAGYLLGSLVRPEGYAYVSSSGRIGPLALRDDAAVEPALAFCLARLREMGAAVVSLKVPGVCRAGLCYLLDHGLHLERTLLILASEPFGQMDRYIPSGSDALL